MTFYAHVTSCHRRSKFFLPLSPKTETWRIRRDVSHRDVSVISYLFLQVRFNSLIVMPIFSWWYCNASTASNYLILQKWFPTPSGTKHILGACTGKTGSDRVRVMYLNVVELTRVRVDIVGVNGKARRVLLDDSRWVVRSLWKAKKRLKKGNNVLFRLPKWTVTVVKH